MNLTPLTQADRITPLWRRMRIELRAEIEVLRTSLEKTQPPETTASTRAKLTVLREILALETDRATDARRPQAAPQDVDA